MPNWASTTTVTCHSPTNAMPYRADRKTSLEIARIAAPGFVLAATLSKDARLPCGRCKRVWALPQGGETHGKQSDKCFVSGHGPLKKSLRRAVRVALAFRPASKPVIFLIPSGLQFREGSAFSTFSATCLAVPYALVIHLGFRDRVATWMKLAWWSRQSDLRPKPAAERRDDASRGREPAEQVGQRTSRGSGDTGCDTVSLAPGTLTSQGLNRLCRKWYRR